MMSNYQVLPSVPEGVLDVSAAVNQLAYVLESVSQANVISMGLTTPPGSVTDGDMYIPGVGATGVWLNQGDNLAKYVAEGAHWDFFKAGVLVRWVIDMSDGTMHYFDSTSNGWTPVA